MNAVSLAVLGAFAVVAVLLVLGLVALVSRPQAARPAPELARAAVVVHPSQVASLRDRLGHDVRTLSPGDDPVARQALSDAAERYDACSVLLERAQSQAELRTAWLAAVEGLTSSRLVRRRLGLDAGPDVPPPPALH